MCHINVLSCQLWLRFYRFLCVQAGSLSVPAAGRPAGASTDACYGIRRFRTAAQASDLEEALHKEDGVFQLQHIETKYLQLRVRAVAAGDGQATCSQFKAASQTARRHELFQWHGILATVCRPEYIVHAMHREGN